MNMQTRTQLLYKPSQQLEITRLYKHDIIANCMQVSSFIMGLKYF